ncbi:MAG: hypothetical protein LBR46_00215 [Prevotella sp.]|jgi:hypothetical protein|nr:hypothetical protein [Prevotella sp.]
MPTQVVMHERLTHLSEKSADNFYIIHLSGVFVCYSLKNDGWQPLSCIMQTRYIPRIIPFTVFSSGKRESKEQATPLTIRYLINVKPCTSFCATPGISVRPESNLLMRFQETSRSHAPADTAPYFLKFTKLKNTNYNIMITTVLILCQLH